MKNKTIPASMIGVLADKYIYQEAEQENAELGHALKNISEKELKDILRSRRAKVIAFKRVLKERIAWAVSMAAMLAIAITLPLQIEKQSQNKVDGLIYSYNKATLEELQVGARGGEASVDITTMNDTQLKSILGQLEVDYQNSDNLQDVAINGQILALSYIRLHDRENAKKTLNSMISQLSSERDDYSEIIEWCETIIKQLD